MPLRDHFRPPLDLKRSWGEVHGGWPMMIVQHLYGKLPPGYTAGPGVHLGGTSFEVDMAATRPADTPPPAGGGTATAVARQPTRTAVVELPDPDEFEVRVYDSRRSRRLVAAVELVSPSNKDRPKSRRDFANKCVGLLADGVSVTVVDVVTHMGFNLYAELLEVVGGTDPALSDEPPATYAVALRGRDRHPPRSFLDAWYYPLAVGEPLPELPLWLGDDLFVPLDLEASYEATCKYLYID